MNLEELVTDLAAQADRVDDTGHSGRLRSVHGRITVARRRRASGALSLAAAVIVAGIITATSVLGDRTSAPPVGTPSKPPSVAVEFGGDFPTSVGSMTLIDGVVGPQGHDELSMTLEVSTNRVAIRVWCFGEGYEDVRYNTDVRESPGAPGLGGDCDAHRPSRFVPRDAAEGLWAGGSGPPGTTTLDLPRGGGSLTLTTRLLSPPARHRLRLAVAVYAVPDPVAHIAGLDLYPLWFDGESTHELLAYGETEEGAASVTVDVPAAPGAVVGYFSYNLEPTANSRVEVLADGKVVDVLHDPAMAPPGSPGVSLGGGGGFDFKLAPGSPHRVEMRLTGVAPGSARAAMVFYSVLEDGGQ